ncbi:MAG TPA: hypothetical protein PKD96_02055 [Candidatus Absconditabacterales bacterium]|nr:hypothetical protein [Candidatus Absconditabacterales bacterium]HMT27063.1 hypothetical protein [Candidatus Absconditabacterales bacterium]
MAEITKTQQDLATEMGLIEPGTNVSIIKITENKAAAADLGHTMFGVQDTFPPNRLIVSHLTTRLLVGEKIAIKADSLNGLPLITSVIKEIIGKLTLENGFIVKTESNSVYMLKFGTNAVNGSPRGGLSDLQLKKGDMVITTKIKTGEQVKGKLLVDIQVNQPISLDDSIEKRFFNTTLIQDLYEVSQYHAAVVSTGEERKLWFIQKI